MTKCNIQCCLVFPRLITFQLITLMRVFSFCSYFEFTIIIICYNFTRGLLLLFFIILYVSSQLSLVPLPNTDTQVTSLLTWANPSSAFLKKQLLLINRFICSPQIALSLLFHISLHFMKICPTQLLIGNKITSKQIRRITDVENI